MFKFFARISNDTLKRFDENGKRRWSRTSLTMLTAWIVTLFMALFDFLDNGLRFDVWVALLTVATGIKIADSYSKKINDGKKL
tara:strand:- start:685 stop:933 length:249 start_codon:yes stop_codon:yes gene_type:complete